MFGYIKPFVPELKVREQELYRAVYCGLCKSMGRGTYFYSRLSLSYDMVFLALVRSSLTGAGFELKSGVCGLNPFRRRLTACDCETLRYCAAASAYLTYYKVLDNVKDGRGIKKLLAKCAVPAVKSMKKRASRLGVINENDLETELTRLASLEEARTPSLDAPAECFGRLLSCVFSSGLEGDAASSAGLIGLNTGRFIYAANAADDLEDDRAKNAYNPLLYGDLPDDDKLDAVRDAMCIWAQNACGELMLEGADAPQTDIAVNIMKLGMIKTACDVTERPKPAKKHRKDS